MTEDPARLQERFGVSRETIERLETHRRLLCEWSERMNLVAPSTLELFWSRHALDSLQLLALAPTTRRWLDMGAGAGFPGLVIAAALKGLVGADVTLIESISKKAAFLSAVVEASDLPVRVRHMRIEDFRFASHAEVVCARALAPLPRLLEYARPFLNHGAIGLFHKGASVDAELEAAGFKALGGAYSNGPFRADKLASVSNPRGSILRVQRV